MGKSAWIVGSAAIFILAGCSQREEQQSAPVSSTKTSVTKPDRGTRAPVKSAPATSDEVLTASLPASVETTIPTFVATPVASAVETTVSSATGNAVETPANTPEIGKPEPEAAKVPSQNPSAPAKLPKSAVANQELNTLNKVLRNLWPGEEDEAIGKVPMAERVAEAADHIEHLRTLVSQNSYTADKKELVEKQFERFTEALSQYGSATDEESRSNAQRTLQDSLSEIEGQLR